MFILGLKESKQSANEEKHSVCNQIQQLKVARRSFCKLWWEINVASIFSFKNICLIRALFKTCMGSNFYRSSDYIYALLLHS